MDHAPPSIPGLLGHEFLLDRVASPAQIRRMGQNPGILFAAVLAGLGAIHTSTVAAATFSALGDLPGGKFFSVATSVSADGRVVCGYSASAASGTSYEAFRWTSVAGMTGLGDLAGGSFTSFANGISGDGSTIVGSSVSAGGEFAFRWTEVTGMVSLGELPGGNVGSLAFAVSHDGSVIVGHSPSSLSGTRPEAFRWTAADGMVGLGFLAGPNFSSRAWAVSADGSVVVGESSSTSGNTAFRWSAASGMIGLGDLPGGLTNSIGYAVSADGSVVTGYGTPLSNVHEAFRWTEGAGMVGLGALPCDTWTIGRATSGDGSLIIGDPQISSCRCVFIWDAEHGLRELKAVLAVEHGLDLTGWELCRATAVSPDGETIVGYGTNPAGQTEGWIVQLGRPKLEVQLLDGKICLSWPTNAQGFMLESTGALSGSDWQISTATPVPAGTNFTVMEDVSAEPRFFRLKK